MKHWKLCVRRKFDAAHHLPHHVGKCKQVHGHTWVVAVEITYSGELPDDGMIMDFGDIKEVVDKLDHPGYELNEVIPNPTAENIAEFLRKRIHVQMRESVYQGAGLLVRVWESDDTYVELS